MSTRTARTLAIATSVLSTSVVPVVLAATGTWTPALPAPGAVRQWIAQPISAGFVTALTATAAVGLWLLLTTAVLTHAYGVLGRRLRWTATLRLPGPIQSLTAALLGATAVTTATGATAHAAPVATSSGDFPAAEPAAAAPAPPATARTHADPPPATRVGPIYTVHRGDSLCQIAAQTLGDADRWPEIYALNRGSHFPRVGGTLRDPNLIYPGWTLDLPADATPPTRHPPRTPVHPPPRDGRPDTQASPPAPHTPPTTPAPATNAPPPPTSSPQATATPVSPEAPGPTLSAPDTASPAAQDTGRVVDRATRGVCLSSGSWVDLGLALAIAAAVALVWAYRRRRYVPRQPTATPRLNDPDLAPMPRVVRQILRGLRRAAVNVPVRYDPARQQGGHDDAPHDIADEPLPTGMGDGSDDRDTDVHSTSARSAGNGGAEPAPPPAWDNPLSALWPPAGLALTGPGAEAAARGLLTAALASGDTQQAPTEVVIPSTTAATLLGAAASTLPYTPRLTVTASLDEALDLLEAQTMRRTRLLYQHEVDSVTELRRVDPYEEPLPPVMLLTAATNRHEHARVTALLAQGQHLDIQGVLLGIWPDDDTTTGDGGTQPAHVGRLAVLHAAETTVVAADGTTRRADGERCRHGAHPADIGRLAVLTPAETTDLLVTLAESHTGQPQSPTPIEPATAVSGGAADPTRPTQQATQPQAVQPAAGAPDTQTSPAAEPARPRPSSDDRAGDGAALPESGTGPAAAATTAMPAAPTVNT